MATYAPTQSLYDAPAADDAARRALLGQQAISALNRGAPPSLAGAQVQPGINAPPAVSAASRGAPSLGYQTPGASTALSTAMQNFTGGASSGAGGTNVNYGAPGAQATGGMGVPAVNTAGSGSRTVAGTVVPAGYTGLPVMTDAYRQGVTNLGTIAQAGGAIASNAANAAGAAAGDVSAASQVMANRLNAQAGRAVPQVSVMGGADASAQQSGTLATLRSMNPAADASAALAATRGANVAGASNQAFNAATSLHADQLAQNAYRAVEASSPGEQAQIAVNNLSQLNPTAPLQQALTDVRGASPTAEAQATLGRLRAFDPAAVPSAAQAQLTDQASQDFANTLSLARSGGTASERAWNLRAAEAQNFERSNQLGRTMAGLRAKEASDQSAQKLSALGTEASLAAGIGGLDVSKLGLQANTAGQVGDLQLRQGVAEVQGAQGVGELGVQRLNQLNQAAGTAGQLQVAQNANQINAAQNAGALTLGQLQAAQSGAADVGQLQLGRSAQEVQAAQGVDANRLQANTAQAQTNVQLQELADRYGLGSQQLASNTYLQGAQLAQSGNAQAANLALLSAQLPYQAQQDVNASTFAEAQLAQQALAREQGLALQVDAANAAKAAMPWQIASGFVGGGLGVAATALSDKRAKTAIQKLRDSDASRDIERTPGYLYRYKPGMGEDATVDRLGPMVQDIERKKTGRELVQKRPDGMKELRLDRMVLQQHSVLGSALRRLRQLERKAA